MRKYYSLPDAYPRLVEVDTSTLGVRSYDIDNGYPQRMINLYNASGSAKMCARLCATYQIGKGWEDLTFYNSVIGIQGKRKLTPDKLLRSIAWDKSRLRSFAIHINYNALYQVDSVKFIPVENCRDGIDKETGKIGVYKDWFNSRKFGKYRRKDNIDFIDVYDPTPEVIEQQVYDAGGWELYKGQVYYHSDDGSDYALATIDPVLDDVEAEIASAITRKTNIRNNFRAKGTWVEKGQDLDEDGRQEVVNTVRNFMGPEGNEINVVFSEDPDGKDVPQFIPFQTTLNDKLFEYTDKSARAAIYMQFQQPAILHSDYNGTNGYNEGQLPQSQEYYNSVTEPDRILFEEVFREIFSKFKENINPTDNYRISPIQPLKTAQNGNTINNS